MCLKIDRQILERVNANYNWGKMTSIYISVNRLCCRVRINIKTDGEWIIEQSQSIFDNPRLQSFFKSILNIFRWSLATTKFICVYFIFQNSTKTIVIGELNINHGMSEVLTNN